MFDESAIFISEVKVIRIVRIIFTRITKLVKWSIIVAACANSQRKIIGIAVWIGPIAGLCFFISRPFIMTCIFVLLFSVFLFLFFLLFLLLKHS